MQIILSLFFFIALIVLIVYLIEHYIYSKVNGEIKNSGIPIELALSFPFSNFFATFILFILIILAIVLGFEFQKQIDEKEAEKIFKDIVRYSVLILLLFLIFLIFNIRDCIANRKLKKLVQIIEDIDFKEGIVSFKKPILCRVGFLEIYGTRKGAKRFIEQEKSERRKEVRVERDYFLIYPGAYSVFPAIKIEEEEFKGTILVVIPELDLKRLERRVYECKGDNCIEGSLIFEKDKLVIRVKHILGKKDLILKLCIGAKERGYIKVCKKVMELKAGKGYEKSIDLSLQNKIVLTHNYVKPLSILMKICGIKIPSFAGNLQKFGNIEIKISF